jgi:glycosyltransferase involved in cell wall biosynthesis
MVSDLSICIPTYQRPDYLRWTLRKLGVDFPDAQICVSDNDSTHRPYVIEGGRYVQQTENIGPFPNMYAAFSMATRKYAVYCADDDYLLPAGIARGLAYMEAHPQVAAYCAPCEIWNEVEQTPYWNAWGIDEPTTFECPVALWNFIIEKHVWPEHMIYRLPLPLKPRTRAYWAFADIPDILEHGHIHFSPTPFYRNLLVHPVGERVQLGNVQCLTYFDEYRAGLEVLAFGLFGQQPHHGRQKLQDMIASFICSRMDVAAKLYLRQGHEADAIMLKKRIAIADPRRDAA